MAFPKIAIRPMRVADLDDVLDVQRNCYVPAMNEPGEVILERLTQAPGFCWVAAVDRRICAYLATYPSQLGKITPLGGSFEIAEAPDCLYIHDLAVAPQAGGQGVGAALVRHALSGVPDYPAALVCVQDALNFWQRAGFVEHAVDDAVQRTHLQAYPGTPRYMVRAAEASGLSAASKARPTCRTTPAQSPGRA
ncbi:GNAT family N-acetyltransferase [Azonexus sp. R2A61]|uniref:GNAT family N-acetyltransferase n=1 Tax=Azonexus sp. R2A61 TaxID=2744443 RepID=UPI001F46EDF8|nr:GNAT family N-acetyltransferase [Azonexus sp. R2A61]